MDISNRRDGTNTSKRLGLIKSTKQHDSSRIKKIIKKAPDKTSSDVLYHCVGSSFVEPHSAAPLTNSFSVFALVT